VVGVVAHQRGQIEGDGKTAAPLLQQILVALIGFFRRGKAGKLAHRPQLAAIACGVNAAGIRGLSRMAEVLFGVLVPICGEIGGGIEPLDRNAGDGGEAGGAIGIAIGTGIGSDGPLRRFGERGRQGGVDPLLFRRKNAAGRFGRRRSLRNIFGGASRHTIPLSVSL
jgi:hypothetical protein